MFYNKQQERKIVFEFFKQILKHLSLNFELWLFKRKVE